MKLLITILLLTITATAQCRELKGREFFANIRFSAPATITDFSGPKLFYVISTAQEVFISEIAVSDRTEFPKDFAKTYKKGRHFFVTCADTGELLWVQPVRQSAKYVTKEKLQ